MTQVVLTGYILVPESELTAVKNALTHHIELTRQEPGCLVFEVTQEANNPCRFDVYEVFTDQEAFAAHQQRVQASEWGKISVNVERFYQTTIQ